MIVLFQLLNPVGAKRRGFLEIEGLCFFHRANSFASPYKQ